MRILKLLNKKYLSIVIIFLFTGLSSQAQEPIDIWKIENKNSIEDNIPIENTEEKNIPKNKIYEMQSQKTNQLKIQQDKVLISNKNKIIGLYDPAENGLNINMWSNSSGDEILKIFKIFNNIKLSDDAIEILDILLLTNAYYPEKNISKKEFLEIKSNWLIKNSDLKLIEDYLLKNKTINENSRLTKYLVNYYLSRSEVRKSCEIFSKIKETVEDKYLSKFKIYCLINDDKKDQAQLLLDLKKELGFKDKFYENKIDYLMGYVDEPDIAVSEKTILDFHLSHRTNPNFKFIPKNNTSKKIWKYLSTSNLLYNIQDIEIEDLDKISIIEKATHEKNYSEEELFEFYKRFQFSINQLLNIKESSKVLSAIET